ncbi:MAG TPA: sensor histidine kinase [Candidatus Nitrosopolaris sp.]|nr:sensor histidine kinase [Candidatus Nitrosopolaris sp.]
MLERNPSTNIVILVVIAGIAIVLSIFSYQYSILTSNKIVDIASQEVRSNTRIEVHDIALILANKLQTVDALLKTLAESSAIHNNEYKSADVVINGREHSSNDMTDFYMWLNKDGKINWISDINQTTYQKYKGTDLSYRPYYSIPTQTHSVYYSRLIESNDKIPRLYISYPVINTTGGANGIVTGVVVTSIRLQTLGNFLSKQLLPQFNSTIGLLDRNGIILYASNAQQYVGEYVFGNKFQSVLSSSLPLPESKNLLNDIIKRSLQGYTGSGDVLINGKMNTITYQPILVNGKNFLTLYISAQHNLASDVSALIDQQRYFTILVVAIIGAVAIIIAFLVFSWNRRLNTLVNTKTAELKTSNESLAESNNQLAIANEQLKVHDKMQREFINIASHEMKTPTQAILGYSSLIQQHPEKREGMLEAIARNATRLQRLTNDILDVTRIEAQSLNLNTESVKLNKLISDVIDDQRNEIEKTNKDIKILHELQNRSIELEADKNRLTQVISNLLSNAIKFTKNGTIIVTEAVKDGKAVVSIKDTGQGIDPEISPRLFSKFAAKSEAGTGLGLFISKSIVEAHGGKIWAENYSDSDGQKGAVFTFSIPVSKGIVSRQAKENQDEQ